MSITVYSKPACVQCTATTRALDAKGISYTEIEVSTDRTLQTEMIERSGRRTVPQIFFGNLHVGGSDDLADLEASGRLDEMLDDRRRAA